MINPRKSKKSTSRSAKNPSRSPKNSSSRSPNKPKNNNSSRKSPNKPKNNNSSRKSPKSNKDLIDIDTMIKKMIKEAPDNLIKKNIEDNKKTIKLWHDKVKNKFDEINEAWKEITHVTNETKLRKELKDYLNNDLEKDLKKSPKKSPKTIIKGGTGSSLGRKVYVFLMQILAYIISAGVMLLGCGVISWVFLHMLSNIIGDTNGGWLQMMLVAIFTPCDMTRPTDSLSTQFWISMQHTTRYFGNYFSAGAFPSCSQSLENLYAFIAATTAGVAALANYGEVPFLNFYGIMEITCNSFGIPLPRRVEIRLQHRRYASLPPPPPPEAMTNAEFRRLNDRNQAADAMALLALQEPIFDTDAEYNAAYALLNLGGNRSRNQPPQ